MGRRPKTELKCPEVLNPLLLNLEGSLPLKCLRWWSVSWKFKTKIVLGEHRLDLNADKHGRESCSCVLPDRLFCHSAWPAPSPVMHWQWQQWPMLVWHSLDFQISQVNSWNLCLDVWNILNIIRAHLLTSIISAATPVGPCFGWFT